MGYHAPSEEEVYRYMFRLDRGSPGLSDGFGWTLLFVNDNSDVCREFLMKYAAELAFRTADRIRFVFFSGISQQQTQDLLDKPSGGGGMLARVLAATIGWWPRSRYALERESWDALRPTAFHPLDSAARIEQRVSMECQMYSAMPGSQAALGFAQRLGIGRFAPCFVMFSDIGALTVRVLPMADRSATDVFNQLRSWIDAFYEINGSLISKWAAIEKKIQETCWHAEYSLSRLHNWKSEQESNWRSLRRLSSYLARLGETASDDSVLAELRSDSQLPAGVARLVEAYSQSLKLRQQRHDRLTSLLQSMNKLCKKNVGPEQFSGELKTLWDKNNAELPNAIRAPIAETIEHHERFLSAREPQQELMAWWHSEHGRTPSRNRYEKLRAAWASYSIAKYSAAATNNAGSIKGEEFSVVLNACLGRRTSDPVDVAAEAVLSALRSHFDVSPEDPHWEQRTGALKAYLLGYFSSLASYAPRWLLEADARVVPPLTWAECIPNVYVRQMKHGLRGCLETLPRLQSLVSDQTRDWQTHLEQLRTAADATRAKLSAALGQMTIEVRGTISDEKSTRLALVSTLAATRADIEKAVFASLGTLSNPPITVKELTDLAELDRLMGLLREYDCAVESLVMPFEQARDVLRVSLDRSLLGASGLGWREQDPGALERMQSRLQKASGGLNVTKSQWPAIFGSIAECNPPGALLAAISRILPPARMHAILTAIGAPSAIEAIPRLGGEKELVALLDLLNIDEILDLERQLHVQPASSGPASSREELFNGILVAVGLLPATGLRWRGAGTDSNATEELRRKMARDEFDVFLAHNSQDRAAVLKIGEGLRALGIYPWIDVEQILPGQWIQDVLQSALRRVKAVAIVFGPSGLGRWQAVELRAVMSRCVESGIPLIPVLLPGVSAIPESLVFLREASMVHFQRETDDQDALDQLARGISGKRRR